MQNEETVIVDISTLSDCESDIKYIKGIKRQALLLALVGLILFTVALDIKFNQGAVLHSFLHYFISESSLRHPSVFFVFLIASIGNLIAARVLYYEAKNEEAQLKKLKEAFLSSMGIPE